MTPPETPAAIGFPRKAAYALLGGGAALATLAGCQMVGAAHLGSPLAKPVPAVSGTVDFAPPARTAQASGYRTQATMTEIASASTVSLIDPSTGNTVASSVTQPSGSFVLSFSNFTPTTGNAYILEAVKGLSVGGSPNRPGAAAVRIRTLLFWNNGWQSLTNSTVGVGITVSQGTTAVADIAGLWQSAGKALTLSTLINSVSGSTFTPGSSGINVTTDFTPVLNDVSTAITENQDPIADITYDASASTYALAAGMPAVTSLSPAIGTPGGTVVVHGSNFNQLNGTNAFWFGSVEASTWSVSTDGTQATVSIPTTAYCAPFTLQEAGGAVVTVNPFYLLHGTVGTLAGSGAPAFADGTGGQTEFFQPWGISLGNDGALYLGDQMNNRIRRITLAGAVTTVAGNGIGAYLDGPAASAELSIPDAVVMDSNGNLFFSDENNHRIREISPSANVSTFAGNSTSAVLDGTGTSAEFADVWGLAIDSQNNLYAADRGGQCIRKITSTGVVTTLAGSASVAGFVNATGTAAEFNYPAGVAVDSSGNVYVADTSNNCIRKVSPTGVVTTYAGTGVGGEVDGPAANAEFTAPEGIAIDSSGDLFVSDGSQNVYIREISAAGQVTTVAGSGTIGSANGATSSAQFQRIGGLAVAPDGALYVGDFDNNDIRVVMP